MIQFLAQMPTGTEIFLTMAVLGLVATLIAVRWLIQAVCFRLSIRRNSIRRPAMSEGFCFDSVGDQATPLSPPPAEGGERTRAPRARSQAGPTSASVSSAGRNLWSLEIWLEHVLKDIPFHDR